jgi:hypothetical protein
MFDFWYELPPVLRATVGWLMIAVAVGIWFLTGGRLYAIGIGAIGIVFVLFSNAGNDNNGYHF